MTAKSECIAVMANHPACGRAVIPVRVRRYNAAVRPKKGPGVEIERPMPAEDVIDIDAEILKTKSDEQIICHRRENRGGNRF
jgi:hypothetical protein